MSNTHNYLVTSLKIFFFDKLFCSDIIYWWKKLQNFNKNSEASNWSCTRAFTDFSSLTCISSLHLSWDKNLFCLSQGQMQICGTVEDITDHRSLSPLDTQLLKQGKENRKRGPSRHVSVVRSMLLESIRLGRGDISPHHLGCSLEVTGRDNRGRCTEKEETRGCMLIGNGLRCGWVEVDACREGSVARGFDRETRWKWREEGACGCSTEASRRWRRRFLFARRAMAPGDVGGCGGGLEGHSRGEKAGSGVWRQERRREGTREEDDEWKICIFLATAIQEICQFVNDVTNIIIIVVVILIL